MLSTRPPTTSYVPISLRGNVLQFRHSMLENTSFSTSRRKVWFGFESSFTTNALENTVKQQLALEFQSTDRCMLTNWQTETTFHLTTRRSRCILGQHIHAINVIRFSMTRGRAVFFADHNGQQSCCSWQRFKHPRPSYLIHLHEYAEHSRNGPSLAREGEKPRFPDRRRSILLRGTLCYLPPTPRTQTVFETGVRTGKCDPNKDELGMEPAHVLLADKPSVLL